ncbi:MAG TPA: FHA domain-containing protein [Mycobacteriales bacterium]|nr:FHA domain-containing protein [Mycobacteriales bacterium]
MPDDRASVDQPSVDQPVGGGRPRLVVVPEGGHAATSGPEALGYEIEFALEPRRTTIGSGEDQDIVLEGLEPAQGVIEWVADGDEFVFAPLQADGSATVAGGVTTTGIHHGDRLQLGGWTLIFQRDEDFDHVRKDRARQGGQHAGDTRHAPGGHSTETD